MEWQTIPVFLMWDPYEQYEKAKRYDTGRWALQVGSFQGKSGEQLLYSSRKKEAAGPKQKRHSVVGMFGGEIKVQCYKEQYCIGMLGPMNQGKLEVVKQEMERVNIDILGVSELKWMEMGEFNSDDVCIYYAGQKSLRRNKVALIINKRRSSKALSKAKLAHKPRS